MVASGWLALLPAALALLLGACTDLDSGNIGQIPSVLLGIRPASGVALGVGDSQVFEAWGGETYEWYAVPSEVFALEPMPPNAVRATLIAKPEILHGSIKVRILISERIQEVGTTILFR